MLAGMMFELEAQLLPEACASAARDAGHRRAVLEDRAALHRPLLHRIVTRMVAWMNLGTPRGRGQASPSTR